MDPTSQYNEAGFIQTFPFNLYEIGQYQSSDGSDDSFVLKYFVQIFQFCLKYFDSLPGRTDERHIFVTFCLIQKDAAEICYHLICCNQIFICLILSEVILSDERHMQSIPLTLYTSIHP